MIFLNLNIVRFLWRQNANFAISKHYRRYDVFEEAEANRAAGKYDNSSINEQVDFYIKEGLQPYSEAKLPITSGRSFHVCALICKLMCENCCIPCVCLSPCVCMFQLYFFCINLDFGVCTTTFCRCS